MDDDTKRKLGSIARKAVKVASEVGEIAIHLQKPSKLGLLSVGSKLINSVLEVRSQTLYEQLEGWKRLNGTGSFREFLCKLCKTHQDKAEDDDAPATESKENGSLVQVTIYDYQFAWIEYTSWTEGPWIPDNQDADKSLMVLGRFVWDTLGPRVAVIRPPLGSDMLVPDVSKRGHESQTARDIYDEYVAPFRREKLGFSILFHGESGVGKSQIMSAIATYAGALSLRMAARDIEHMRDAGSAIRLLCPSAVLVDDLERVDNPDAILSQIEQLHDEGLLIASVNKMDELDAACLRPGRFDEVLLIKHLDDGVLDQLIGNDVPPEANARLRKLPVAYIDYFHKIVKARGLEAAVESIPKLEARAKQVKELSKRKKKRKKSESKWAEDNPPTEEHPTEPADDEAEDDEDEPEVEITEVVKSGA